MTSRSGEFSMTENETVVDMEMLLSVWSEGANESLQPSNITRRRHYCTIRSTMEVIRISPHKLMVMYQFGEIYYMEWLLL